MESNDLISREAASEVIRDLFDAHGKWTSWAMIHQALAALPADRRWEELRSWIVARQAKAESYRQWDDLWSMFDLVLDQMDRLAPPADGAENT